MSMHDSAPSHISDPLSMTSPHASTKPALEPEVAKLKTTPPQEGLLARQPLTEGQPQRSQSQQDPHDNTQHAPVDQENSRERGTEASLHDLVVSVQQLSPEDVLKEEERANEKIKQKMRPLSKLNTVRRNLIQTRNDQESAFRNPSQEPQEVLLESGQDHSALGSKLGRRLVHDSEQRASISSMTSASGGGSVAESVARGSLKAKQKRKSPKINLIEVESPRLMDAQTIPGDRRYFQCPGDPEPEGDFVYDFLYQHQRGAFFLGTPKFSSKSLLPVDPDEWTDQTFETSPMDITDYVVPDPSWEWVHKSWLVDMTGDVDEDGWEYAMTFHGSPWHGNYEVFRSFARRRRWLRLRKRKGKVLGKPSPLPDRTYPSTVQSTTWTKLDVSQSHLDSPFPLDDSDVGAISEQTASSSHLQRPLGSKPVDLYRILKKARSDREKLAYTAQYVVRYSGHLHDLERRLDCYLNLLDYETSRREFLSLLAAYSRTDKSAVAKNADHLEFYSDRKKLSQGD
ncbi:hypothetical protein EDD11_003023 [Mortierella claussenii]|nr:hypothetical protein EDD11_003023 [Mortierella claussenii]